MREEKGVEMRKAYRNWLKSLESEAAGEAHTRCGNGSNKGQGCK